MSMQPKVNDAISRLRYIVHHPHKFDRIMIPTVICYLKLIIELSTEIISLSLTAKLGAAEEVVMNYIALGCIAELDEVYYLTIRAPLKERLEEKEFEIPIYNHTKINLRGGLVWYEKFLLLLVNGI
jgi:hypothetical protein